MNIPVAEEPAFPFACQGPTTAPEIYYGMTKREFFAAAATQGLLAGDPRGQLDISDVVIAARQHADALIEELTKPI